MRHLATVFAACVLSCGGSFGAESAMPTPATPAAPATKIQEPDPVVMSDKEIDAFLDNVFEKSRQLTRVRANLTEEISGGVFRTVTKTPGTLTVLLPRLFRLEMFGNSDTPDAVTQLVIGDGSYVWIGYPDDKESKDVERYLLKSFSSGGQHFDLASLFLGAEVKNASEVRRDFSIVGIRQPDRRVELVMLPLKSDMATKLQTLKLRFRDGDPLPEYVRSEMPPEGVRGRPKVIERRITEVETNLTGLTELRPEVFAYPLTKDMTVREKSTDGSERKVPYGSAMEDIRRALDTARAAPPAAAPEKDAARQRTPAP